MVEIQFAHVKGFSVLDLPMLFKISFAKHTHKSKIHINTILSSSNVNGVKVIKGQYFLTNINVTSCRLFCGIYSSH